MPSVYRMTFVLLLVCFGHGGCQYAIGPSKISPRVEETSASETAANSDLVLRPNEVDLGTLFVGAEKRFTSLLRNEGRDMIVIESILANCGCSDIKVEA